MSKSLHLAIKENARLRRMVRMLYQRLDANRRQKTLDSIEIASLRSRLSEKESSAEMLADGKLHV